MPSCSRTASAAYGKGVNGRLDVRVLLAHPRIYRVFQDLVGQRHARGVYVKDHIRPKPGDRVLDIGCGPADILQYLSDVDYVGIDPSHEYIRDARARFGSQGTFLCQDVKSLLSARVDPFDIAFAIGVAHHLDDDAAQMLFAVSKSLLKPQGRLVTIDPCYCRSQSFIERLLVSKDRGAYVRTPEEYRALALSSFASVEVFVRHGLLRIPYTLVIVECSGAPVKREQLLGDSARA